MCDDNIKLEISDINNSNINNDKSLNEDDLITITELINNESNDAMSFNKSGLYIGIGLLGAGAILTTLNMFMINNNAETKPRRIIRKASSMLSIPLTTTGLLLTAYFGLKTDHSKNKCI